jgi:phenylpropionate dioxygenase-like ring-hydroxylating dioxygenase large terminal subunit
MTTAAENEILTRVGPGTPMGELMRQYWIPAVLSSELKPDGDPIRLKILDEKLIAFRDSSGRAGILDHRCPHRRASLFFGRNEQDGIRCVYHGWKYDVDGRCMEMMNLPEGRDLRDKVRAKAYRTAEHNGIVYVFMGSREVLPPLPRFECNLVAGEELHVQFTLRECNWLQAVDGELDTSHVGIMHFGAVERAQLKGDPMQQYLVANRAPEYKIRRTEYGMMYGAYRPADEGRLYWRVAHFLMPFWTMPPINHLATNVLTRGYVPLDDTHTMFISMYKKGAYPRSRLQAQEGAVGASQNYPYLPNSTDWLGRWRLRANRDNDYEIDRDVQRTQSFTGIDGVQLQDQAVQESMGEIVDRENEMLASSDIMVARVRRLLLESALAYKEKGELPLSAGSPDCYSGNRGGQFVADPAEDWVQAYEKQLGESPWQAVSETESLV